MPKSCFLVRLLGYGRPFILEDHDGNRCHTLATACAVAEMVYGSEWAEVTDGETETDRDSAIDAGLTQY